LGDRVIELVAVDARGPFVVCCEVVGVTLALAVVAKADLRVIPEPTLSVPDVAPPAIATLPPRAPTVKVFPAAAVAESVTVAVVEEAKASVIVVAGQVVPAVIW